MDERLNLRNGDTEMQQQAMKWLADQRFTPSQQAAILGCSVQRANKIAALTADMTLREYANVLHHAGLTAPHFLNMPVTHPQQTAPHVPVAAPRRMPKPPRGPTATQTYHLFESAIYGIRTELLGRVALPEIEVDGDHPLEDCVLHTLRGRYQALAARVEGDAAVSLNAYAQRMSLALAVAMARRFTGAQQLELESFYQHNPEALGTQFDLIAMMGGAYNRTDAITLHSMALTTLAAQPAEAAATA